MNQGNLGTRPLLGQLAERLQWAHSHLYTTLGTSWRQIMASLAFETKADLSLILEMPEEDRRLLVEILQAFGSRGITQEEIRQTYLEFFPEPAHFKLGEEPWKDD